MEKNEYNLDERLDHIAYMFNVRTVGKKYENFIVNAIYTKVGEPELMPVTQQYVKSLSDDRGYYLLDLYFPQLKYGVEVDESHHLKEDQKIKDIVRAEDIRAAIECEEDRISIFDDNGNKRSIQAINEDIERVVTVIKNKIAEAAPLKWQTYKDKKAKVLAEGKFRVSDNISYPSITEIYNMCGGIRSGKNKGKAANMLQRCYYRLNSSYKLWVPILAEFDDKGVVLNSKMGYVNSLSEDKTILTEECVHPIDPTADISYKRVVFMRMKNYYGRPCIKFIGVFVLTEESDNKEYVHIYRRVADEVCIKDLMP